MIFADGVFRGVFGIYAKSKPGKLAPSNESGRLTWHWRCVRTVSIAAGICRRSRLPRASVPTSARSARTASSGSCTTCARTVGVGSRRGPFDLRASRNRGCRSRKAARGRHDRHQQLSDLGVGIAVWWHQGRSTQRVGQRITSHPASPDDGICLFDTRHTSTPPPRHREWSGQCWVACVKPLTEALCRHGQDLSRKHISSTSLRFECQPHNPRTRRERKIV